MKNDPLKSLCIRNLRGSITPFTLEFEKGKKLTVIYGENGTGKSTICDALDFIGNGNVGSLDNRGLGKTGKYWHSVGTMPKDVNVALVTATGECSASLVKTDVIVKPSDKRPKVQVLRRGQILNLVEARPADRYNAIKAFIDVSGIEASELALAGLIKDLTKSIDEAVVRVDANRESIARFWEQVGKPGKEALTWANSEVSKDHSSFEYQRAALDALIGAYNKVCVQVERYQKQLNALSQAERDSEAAAVAVQDLNAKVAGEYLEVLEILQAADRHFANHPSPDICPLCESAEYAASLPEKVKVRIAAQAIATELAAAKRALETREQMWESEKSRLMDAAEDVKGAATEFALKCKQENVPADAPLPTPFPDEVAHWQEWIDSTQELPSTWRGRTDDLAHNKNFINTLRASLDALAESSSIQHELEELLPKLKATLDVVEGQRKKFTDEILQAIAAEVGRLYEEVHPGEGLNKISMELDAVKRASLEIATEFQGVDGTPPQAYFSDSHLDTLGLCVFLALAQKEAPDETILVLDDVLASVDEPHVERLIEMLYKEAAKFRQCIITTHYKPWKEKLRWGWLKNGQCQFVELSKWTAKSGMSLTRSIPDIDRLRALLAEDPPDLQLVCAKAGVILEAALDFLTQTYECHVPRRPSGLYTLGDLLPALDRKLRAALRLEHKQILADGSITYVEKCPGAHLDELSRIMQSRNVFGAHFNALSFELLDADALRFGAEVLALADCLIDPVHGWPRSSRSGSYWATADETRRLHPLRRPG